MKTVFAGTHAKTTPKQRTVFVPAQRIRINSIARFAVIPGTVGTKQPKFANNLNYGRVLLLKGAFSAFFNKK